MKNKRWFPIIYMFAVTFIFSSVVIGLTMATQERVDANQELAFEKAVLKVLPGQYDDTLNRTEIHNRFMEKVSKSDDLAGAFALRENGRITAYAVPIEGQGFWAPIKGVIGLKTDKTTITGIAFYEQNETPGLGAEITKPEFRNQFEDKKLSSDAKLITFQRPSEKLGPSEVHAVTGATQTSVRLEKIINEELKQWLTAVRNGSKRDG